MPSNKEAVPMLESQSDLPPQGISTDLIGFLPVSTIEMNLSRTLGKILTILDAAIADPRQNKACKDLIRAELSSVMNYFDELSQPDNEIRPYKKLQPVF